jgi:hypothetical protein
MANFSLASQAIAASNGSTVASAERNDSTVHEKSADKAANTAPGAQAPNVLSFVKPPPAAFEATLSPPLGQFVVNSFLQVAALVAAVAFGVFAIRSVQLTQTANGYAVQALDQSIMANNLALVSVCLSGYNIVSDGVSYVFLSSLLIYVEQ